MPSHYGSQGQGEQQNAHPALMDMQGGESQHGTMQGGQFYPDQDAQLVQQIQEAMQRGPDPTRAIRSQQMRQGDPNGVERAIEAFLNALAASYGARPPRVPTEIDDGAADHAAAYRPLHDMEPLANAGPGGEAPANPARAAFAMTPLVSGEQQDLRRAGS